MDTDLAYLAGIIDGEGSFSLKWQKNRMSLDLVVHVFNSDLPLMEWLKDRFGGSYYEIHRKARQDKPQWQPVYNWHVTGETARDLCEKVATYLIVKRAQAELAVEFWDNRQSVPRLGGRKGVQGWQGRDRPSDEVIALRASYKERMHALNRKNRGAIEVHPYAPLANTP